MQNHGLDLIFPSYFIVPGPPTRQSGTQRLRRRKHTLNVAVLGTTVLHHDEILPKQRPRPTHAIWAMGERSMICSTSILSCIGAFSSP